MKIDTPLTTDLALGVGRRIIDPSDSIVEVPSSITPTSDIMAPTQTGGFLTNNPLSASFLTDYIITRNNAAAVVNDLIITLNAGLWTLNFLPVYSFTFATGIGINQQLTINFNDGGFSVPVWRLWLTPNANQYAVGVPTKFRVLTRNQATLTFNAMATAAGDTFFFSASIQGERNI